MSAVQLIGAAWGLGAKDAGCADGPTYLQGLDMLQKLQRAGVHAHWRTILQPNPSAASVPLLCQALAKETAELVRTKQRFAVVGGDHSCAMGTWHGVATELDQSPGLIWIDAHLDAHTPSTTESGALHGMPVAALLGYGDVELSHIGNLVPAIQHDRLCLLGVRSFEADEAKLINDLKIRVFYMEEIQHRGMPACLQEAVKHVTKLHTGFGISLDLDAIDPQQAPGVGTPVTNGIDANQLLDALKIVASHPQLLGLEIAEFNPHRDLADITANLVMDLITHVFQNASGQAA